MAAQTFPEFETIRYDERDDGVAIVTLNRPDVYNAFNSLMQRELHQVWRLLRRHDPVRCIVLTGAGDRAFCTGIDRMEQMGGASVPDGPRGSADAPDPSVVGSGETPFMFNVGPLETGDRRGQRDGLRRRVLHAR
jgi:enoyl-CoA hydratase/carnithine racemase